MFFPFNGKLINTDHITMVKLRLEEMPRGYILNGDTYGGGITPTPVRSHTTGEVLEEHWDSISQYPYAIRANYIHRLVLLVTVGVETFKIHDPEGIGQFAHALYNDRTHPSIAIALQEYAKRCVKLRSEDIQKDKDKAKARKVKRSELG